MAAETRYTLARGNMHIRYRPFEQKDARMCSELLVQEFTKWKGRVETCAYAKAAPMELLLDYFGREFILPYVCDSISTTARQRNYHVVLLEEAGTVIGVGGVERFPGSKAPGAGPIPAADLKDLVVEEEYRGRGIGSLLAGELVSLAVRSGIYHLYAHAPPEAKGIFTSLGFAQQKAVVPPKEFFSGRYVHNLPPQSEWPVVERVLDSVVGPSIPLYAYASLAPAVPWHHNAECLAQL